MLKALVARFREGCRTGAFPPSPPNLPPDFKGRPEISADTAAEDIDAMKAVCPVDDALSFNDGRACLDMGRCIFCGKCAEVCDAVKFGKEYRMAVMQKSDLIADGTPYIPPEPQERALADFCGKSLKIRQVSAGGCAACELDFNVLNTLAWDMGRFGIQVVASPRHADCILVTGPVSQNMLLALKKTYDAAPRPVWVIACGSCAVSGGIFAGSPEANDGVDNVLPVDLYIPGCPPHPSTILEGILRLMGKKAGEEVKA
jgi:Ni,Fe-hydrogenase III small subunit